MYRNLFKDVETWHLPVLLSAVGIPCLTTGLAMGFGNWWLFLGGLAYGAVAVLSTCIKIRWR